MQEVAGRFSAYNQSTFTSKKEAEKYMRWYIEKQDTVNESHRVFFRLASQPNPLKLSVAQIKINL